MHNRAYALGYITSYSKELGIDPREALKFLDVTYQHQKNSLPEKNTIQTTSNSTSQNSTLWNLSPVSLMSIAGGALAIIILIFLVKSNGIKESASNIPTPISQQTLSDKTPLKQQKAVEVESEEQIVAEDSNPDEKSDEIKEQIHFYHAINPLYTIAENIDEESKKLLPAHIINKSTGKKQNVYITAYAGTTWLTYKKDREKIRKVLLEKDQTLFISGDEIRLFFGNIKAAKLFLNNNLMLTPSRSGVKSLIIPIENQEKYKLPLFVFEEESSKVSTSDEYIKDNN